MVKSCGNGFKVPLADDGGLVTGLPKVLGGGWLATVELVTVLPESIEVRVLAGLDDRPCGTTEGVGDITFPEKHAFVSEFVEVRGRGEVCQHATVSTHSLGRMVIGEDKQYVWLVGRKSRTNTGKEQAASEEFYAEGIYHVGIFT